MSGSCQPSRFILDSSAQDNWEAQLHLGLSESLWHNFLVDNMKPESSFKRTSDPRKPKNQKSFITQATLRTGKLRHKRLKTEKRHDTQHQAMLNMAQMSTLPQEQQPHHQHHHNPMGGGRGMHRWGTRPLNVRSGLTNTFNMEADSPLTMN